MKTDVGKQMFVPLNNSATLKDGGHSRRPEVQLKKIRSFNSLSSSSEEEEVWKMNSDC